MCPGTKILPRILPRVKKGKMTFSQQAQRLDLLREQLVAHHLDGFVVPRGDDYQGEFVPERAERLRWLTGFSGSDGLALVTQDKGAIFVSGRYSLQVRKQVDVTRLYPRDLSDGAWQKIITDFLPDGGRIGYDPWLHSVAWLERQNSLLKHHKIEWVAVEHNLVDSIWADQPAPPDKPAFFWPLDYAGVSVGDKIVAVRERLAAMHAAEASLLITQPDHLAWLLNIRGDDIPFTPVFLARALLAPDGKVTLFTDQARIPPDVRQAIDAQIATQHPSGQLLIVPPEQLARHLTGQIHYDPARTPAIIGDMLRNATAIAQPTPIDGLKAIANPVELKGMVQAHRRDAVAMIGFLRWLEEAAQDLDNNPQTEISIAEKLLWFRQQQEHFVQPSFDTIAGFAENGAIIHYRATPDTDTQLVPGQLLLLDSGAQYLDGTTDITRTVPIGTPVTTMCYHYTLVLRGHIALSAALFPPGTLGGQIDALARLPLWQNGLDYDHGTGHGVGCFLGVHDGPQRVSKFAWHVALAPGMILSNEPGYYLADHYGIRLENLVQVSEIPIFHENTGRSMLGFQPLTMVPFCRDLIRVDLLNEREKRWINEYHQVVLQEIIPLLVDDRDRAWLEKATAPI